MATRQEFKLSEKERQRRSFSTTFKKQKVKELELGITRPCELHREYEVSYSSIYKWIDKFGIMKGKKPEKLIVETQSDTIKLIELKKRVADLERVVGQKQILLDFKSKMIELAEEYYDIDIKKKFTVKPSDTSGKTGKK